MLLGRKTRRRLSPPMQARASQSLRPSRWRWNSLRNRTRRCRRAPRNRAGSSSIDDASYQRSATNRSSRAYHLRPFTTRQSRALCWSIASRPNAARSATRRPPAIGRAWPPYRHRPLDATSATARWSHRADLDAHTSRPRYSSAKTSDLSRFGRFAPRSADRKADSWIEHRGRCQVYGVRPGG